MTLSKQQYRCLYYLTRGMSHKEIAHSMDLSPRTVEYYMYLIKKKVGTKSRTELVDYFIDCAASIVPKSARLKEESE